MRRRPPWVNDNATLLSAITACVERGRDRRKRATIPETSMKRIRFPYALISAGLLSCIAGAVVLAQQPAKKPLQQVPPRVAANAPAARGDKSAVGPQDMNQWATSPARNNVSDGKNIPSEWETGDFDRKTG